MHAALRVRAHRIACGIFRNSRAGRGVFRFPKGHGDLHLLLMPPAVSRDECLEFHLRFWRTSANGLCWLWPIAIICHNLAKAPAVLRTWSPEEECELVKAIEVLGRLSKCYKT
jgi:hypothetical protein